MLQIGTSLVDIVKKETSNVKDDTSSAHDNDKCPIKKCSSPEKKPDTGLGQISRLIDSEREMEKSESDTNSIEEIDAPTFHLSKGGKRHRPNAEDNEGLYGASNEEGKQKKRKLDRSVSPSDMVFKRFSSEDLYSP